MKKNNWIKAFELGMCFGFFSLFPAEGYTFPSFTEAPCITVHSPAIGDACKTSKGFVFIRAKDGWQDTGPEGKLWFDDETPRSMNQFRSVDFCESRKKVLPSVSDYRLAIKHGFEEAVNDMNHFGWCWWSSTVLDYASGYAHQYCYDRGLNGYISYNGRGQWDSTFGAICVNR